MYVRVYIYIYMYCRPDNYDPPKRAAVQRSVRLSLAPGKPLTMLCSELYFNILYYPILIYIYIYIYTYLYTSISLSLYVYIYIYTHICMYIYIYIHRDVHFLLYTYIILYYVRGPLLLMAFRLRHGFIEDPSNPRPLKNNMYMCIYIYTYKGIFINCIYNIYIYIYTHIHTYIDVHTMCVYTYVCVYIYIYVIYIYIYIYIDIHIYKRPSALGPCSCDKRAGLFAEHKHELRTQTTKTANDVREQHSDELYEEFTRLARD